MGLAGQALGVFGTGRGKLSVLEAGLKVKAGVKLPLQRMLAASLVERLGFTGAPGTALLEAGGVLGACWGHRPTLAEPRCSLSLSGFIPLERAPCAVPAAQMQISSLGSRWYQLKRKNLFWKSLSDIAVK